MRGSRESVEACGDHSYCYQERGVGRGVINVSSGHDADFRVEAQSACLASVVVEAEPEGTRPCLLARCG